MDGDVREPPWAVEDGNRSPGSSPRPGSQPVVAQVAVDVLQAVVPVEDQVALLDRPQPGHAELDHRVEVPKEDGVKR
jgi:hypothetical protein